MNLKVFKEGMWESWDGGERRGRCCNYIKISKKDKE